MTPQPTTPLPALYLGHGAPPLLDDEVWTRELRDLANRLPRPRAILVVSAHWEEAPLAVSSPDPAPLVYDFSGFERRFYELTYPTPAAHNLMDLLTAVMPASQPLHVHRGRGLDHGAWVPLLVMYPKADIPVLQLSIPSHDPERLLALGGRLRALREHGVLVVGSGFLTHGLPFLRREDWLGTAAPPSWSVEFDQWAAAALAGGDVEELSRYRSAAPGMPFAHPTVEHFTPLFVTLGAAVDAAAPVRPEIAGFFLGLSKRSFSVT